MTNLIKGFENKTIGIIGLGYIGKHLFQSLHAHSADFNIKIHCFDRKNLHSISQYTFDYLFNCAGYTGDFRSKPFETLEAHIDLPIFLLKNAQVKEAFISLSSTRIYGFIYKKNILFDEDYTSNNPHTEGGYIYDGSKKMMEAILLNQASHVNYKIIIPRLSNVYGKFTPDDLNDSTFLKVMLKAKINNQVLSTNQHKNSAKDYIFIDDALNGILRAALFSKKSNYYNIASGESHSIQDWAQFLDIKIKYQSQDKPVFSHISLKKAQLDLNFYPQYHLKNLNFSQIIIDEPNRAV